MEIQVREPCPYCGHSAEPRGCARCNFTAYLVVWLPVASLFTRMGWQTPASTFSDKRSVP